MLLNDRASGTILVVDDDAGHCELIRRNLRRLVLRNNIVAVHNGQDALDYVRDRRSHSGHLAGERLLLLLDINMPGAVNGLDVLRQLKADATTQSVPVIMLTSTEDPREVARCYALGCNVYITKPVDSQQFIEAIRRIGLFIDIVRVAPLTGEPAA